MEMIHIELIAVPMMGMGVGMRVIVRRDPMKREREREREEVIQHDKTKASQYEEDECSHADGRHRRGEREGS